MPVRILSDGHTQGQRQKFIPDKNRRLLTGFNWKRATRATETSSPIMTHYPYSRLCSQFSYDQKKIYPQEFSLPAISQFHSIQRCFFLAIFKVKKSVWKHVLMCRAHLLTGLSKDPCITQLKIVIGNCVLFWHSIPRHKIMTQIWQIFSESLQTC